MTIPRWPEGWKEAKNAFKEVRKLDDCCINQLNDYAKKQFATPGWASSEIERAFIIGYIEGKKTHVIKD